MLLVATDITLRKFAEDTYDEDWDQGTPKYTDHIISARIKYDLTERDFTELGDNLQLDAILAIRQIDLDALSFTIANQDRFVLDTKIYRITKFRYRLVAGEKVGYEIGIKEIL